MRINESKDQGSQERRVILVFLRHYLPGYKSGGPIRTIANLVETLGDEFDFRIVTSDRDANDSHPHNGLQNRQEWIQVGKAKVRYLAPNERSLSSIAKILRTTPHDTLYLNSFFDLDFSIKPLLARHLGLAPRTRCLLAPRGEFAPAALALKSLKKRIFLNSSKISRLHKNLDWQASSDFEAAHISAAMGQTGKGVLVAPNLPGSQVLENCEVDHASTDQRVLRLIFLSRVSPMKNLSFAIEALAHTRAYIAFDIYGPVGDDRYWEECCKSMKLLPPNVEASYRGSVEHHEVLAIMARYDLFLLPTRGENFGHVILESLSAGTPVLIANTTRWRGLEDFGVGWDLPIDDPVIFTEKIELMAHMPKEKIQLMREKARQFARAHISNQDVVQANRRILAAKI